MALGIGLLLGPRGDWFLMSEAPLYSFFLFFSSLVAGPGSFSTPEQAPRRRVNPPRQPRTTLGP